MKGYFIYSIFLLNIFFSQQNIAQEIRSGNLKLYWYKNQPVRCFVKASQEPLNIFLKTNNGIYYSTFKGWHKIEIVGYKLINLSKKEWCTAIRIESGKGFALGDTSKINTRTNLVHQGKIPNHVAYKGEGVVLGFVDTGIDFTHPDFKKKDGSTRVIKIWDQSANTDTLLRPSYGYGEVYDSMLINTGNCPHLDNNGHGTQVAGIGAGNGFSVPDSIADYSGHAPNASIICVKSDFNRPNWTLSVAEAVEWIFNEAEKLDLPCVVNLSVGTYNGSHDGLDLAAQFIDSLVLLKNGRLVVSAAGNGGALPPFHLHTQLISDTGFTYFRANPNSQFGNSIFIETWSDTSDLKNLKLGFGYTDTTSWSDTLFFLDNISQRLDTVIQTPLGGNTTLTTYAEKQGSRILFQILCLNPLPQHLYALYGIGTGAFDSWGSSIFGGSDMIYNELPSKVKFLKIKKYIYPDSNQSIVSSWNCSPNVISVGNYNNRHAYLNQYDTLRKTVDFPVGGKAKTSSVGPNRLNYIKPDISAPGNFTVAAGRFQDLTALKTIPSIGYRLAKGGFHFSNGGTSMAAPVVSGIAALYLQKCPNSNSKTIKLGILNNSINDSSMGILPNNIFGSGKVDAFSALVSTNLSQSKILAKKLTICQGDSIQLSLANHYSTMNWNDGYKKQSRFVTYSDSFYVQYTDESGCKGESDTVSTITVPNPNVFIHSISDSFCLDSQLSLEATGAEKYIWSTNQTAESINVSRAGIYFLTGLDSNNCRGADSIVLTQYLCNTGIEDKKKIAFKVYPNPSNNKLTIKWDNIGLGILTLKWFALDGRLLKKVTEMNTGEDISTIQFDISSFSRGFYWLSIETDKETQSVQVVKN